MARTTPAFADHRDASGNIRVERTDDILTPGFHTGGDSPVRTATSHEELTHCFADVAADREDHVVILIGAGAGPTAPTPIRAAFVPAPRASGTTPCSRAGRPRRTRWTPRSR